MSVVDDQTHADIIELIEARMAEVACGNHAGAAELAALIEGRMGYESPPKSCLPNITPGEWYAKESVTGIGVRADITAIASAWVRGTHYEMDEERERLPTRQEAIANISLMAAAPDVAKVLNELYEYTYQPHTPTTRDIVDIWADAVTALRKAGVDL